MFVCTPTYKRFDACVALVESVYRQKTQPTAMLIYDNSAGGFALYCDQHNIKLPSTCHVKTMRENLGCARAWNRMLKECALINPNEYVVISNDDITFENDVLSAFKESIDNDGIIYCAESISGVNAFSLFMTRLDVLENTVGLFDELFLYPYYEDGDMARRLRLSGSELRRVGNISVCHIGSATLGAYTPEETEAHHRRFHRNALYMASKWGITNPDRWDDANGYVYPFNNDLGLETMTRLMLQNVYGG